MATHRITLTNSRGGIRTMTEQAWKNIPKDKQGTYNGWYPYEGQLLPSQPKKTATVKGQPELKQPPFIPQEVINMREINAAKDAEIAELKARLAAQNSVTEAKNQEVLDTKDFDLKKVEKIDPTGNPVKTKESKK